VVGLVGLEGWFSSAGVARGFFAWVGDGLVMLSAEDWFDDGAGPGRLWRTLLGTGK